MFKIDNSKVFGCSIKTRLLVKIYRLVYDVYMKNFKMEMKIRYGRHMQCAEVVYQC